MSLRIGADGAAFSESHFNFSRADHAGEAFNLANTSQFGKTLSSLFSGNDEPYSNRDFSFSNNTTKGGVYGNEHSSYSLMGGNELGFNAIPANYFGNQPQNNSRHYSLADNSDQGHSPFKAALFGNQFHFQTANLNTNDGGRDFSVYSALGTRPIFGQNNSNIGLFNTNTHSNRLFSNAYLEDFGIGNIQQTQSHGSGLFGGVPPGPLFGSSMPGSRSFGGHRPLGSHMVRGASSMIGQQQYNLADLIPDGEDKMTLDSVGGALFMAQLMAQGKGSFSMEKAVELASVWNATLGELGTTFPEDKTELKELMEQSIDYLAATYDDVAPFEHKLSFSTKKLWNSLRTGEWENPFSFEKHVSEDDVGLLLHRYREHFRETGMDRVLYEMGIDDIANFSLASINKDALRAYPGYAAGLRSVLTFREPSTKINNIMNPEFVEFYADGLESGTLKPMVEGDAASVTTAINQYNTHLKEELKGDPFGYQKYQRHKIRVDLNTLYNNGKTWDQFQAFHQWKGPLDWFRSPIPPGAAPTAKMRRYVDVHREYYAYLQRQGINKDGLPTYLQR